MVAPVGGHYGETFCGEKCVTQGNPLSPTIFNVVVDAVVFHLESLVAEREGEDSIGDEGDVAKTEGRKIWDQDDDRRRAEEGQEQLAVKAALFYADWVRLRTNVCKTVGMV